MNLTTAHQVAYNGKPAVIVRIEIKFVATGAKVAVTEEEITC